MDSNVIKALLLSYLRFKKQVPMMATECGGFNSDVLCVKDNILTEFEIKTSKSDLSNDFKKEKHLFYLEDLIAKGRTISALSETNTTVRYSPWYAMFKPHRFCFVVPEELKYFALTKIEGTPYGLMIAGAETIVTEVRPKIIHNDILKDGVKEAILSRMSSEIANLWEQKAKVGRHAKD